MGGARYERALVRALTESGRPAIRAPTSGSATDRELPDVIAGTAMELRGFDAEFHSLTESWAIEAKVTSSTTAYADAEEVEALGRFAGSFGATAFIAAKFKRQGGTRSPFYLVEPQYCRVTDKGTYGVPESDVEERAGYEVYTATDAKAAEVREVGA